jgi:hypothetical protein
MNDGGGSAIAWGFLLKQSSIDVSLRLNLWSLISFRFSHRTAIKEVDCMWKRCFDARTLLIPVEFELSPGLERVEGRCYSEMNSAHV